MAEGYLGEPPQKPPILDWWLSGACANFVLEQRGDVRGAVQVVQGRRGYWLRVWADFYDPNAEIVHQLIRNGLATIGQRAVHMPVYIGVCDYHGGLGSILTEYGFAPITDRAKLVRPVIHWVREPVYESSMRLKPATRVVVTPFMAPEPPTPTRAGSVQVGDAYGGDAVSGWADVGAVHPQPLRT